MSDLVKEFKLRIGGFLVNVNRSLDPVSREFKVVEMGTRFVADDAEALIRATADGTRAVADQLETAAKVTHLDQAADTVQTIEGAGAVRKAGIKLVEVLKNPEARAALVKAVKEAPEAWKRTAEMLARGERAAQESTGVSALLKDRAALEARLQQELREFKQLADEGSAPGPYIRVPVHENVPEDFALRMPGGSHWEADANGMVVQEYRFRAQRGMPQLDPASSPLPGPHGDVMTRMRMHSPDPTAPIGSNSREGWTVNFIQGHHRMTPDGKWFDSRYASLPDGTRLEPQVNAFRREAGEWMDATGRRVTDPDHVAALNTWERNMDASHIPMFPRREGPALGGPALGPPNPGGAPTPKIGGMGGGEPRPGPSGPAPPAPRITWNGKPLIDLNQKELLEFTEFQAKEQRRVADVDLRGKIVHSVSVLEKTDEHGERVRKVLITASDGDGEHFYHLNPETNRFEKVKHEIPGAEPKDHHAERQGRRFAAGDKRDGKDEWGVLTVVPSRNWCSPPDSCRDYLIKEFGEERFKQMVPPHLQTRELFARNERLEKLKEGLEDLRTRTDPAPSDKERDKWLRSLQGAVRSGYLDDKTGKEWCQWFERQPPEHLKQAFPDKWARIPGALADEKRYPKAKAFASDTGTEKPPTSKIGGWGGPGDDRGSWKAPTAAGVSGQPPQNLFAAAVARLREAQEEAKHAANVQALHKLIENVNPEGGTTNCQSALIAAHHRVYGMGDLVALPHGLPDKGYVESFFNRQFEPARGIEDVSNYMKNWGNGSSGALWFYDKTGEISHGVLVFNADGRTYILDAQNKLVVPAERLEEIVKASGKEIAGYNFLPTPPPKGVEAVVGTGPFDHLQNPPPFPAAGRIQDAPGPPGGAPMFGMRPQDQEVFQNAAREHDQWILVRSTNPESLPFIGEPGYTPKAIDCKAKTADVAGHPHAGLVADPHLHPSAYRDPAAAQEHWDAMLRSLPDSYKVNENPNSPRYGCLQHNGNYIHADYDLYDLIDPKRPQANLALATKLDGQTHLQTPKLAAVGNHINEGIGSPMIRHGGEAQFTDHSNQRVMAFGPEGQRFEVHGEQALRDLYDRRFEGRRALDHSNPYDPVAAGHEPRGPIGLVGRTPPEGPDPPGGSPPRPPSPPESPSGPRVSPPSGPGFSAAAAHSTTAGTYPPVAPRGEQPAFMASMGSLSQKYESGGDPGRVSSGYLNKAHTQEDLGGVSYGAYQFTSRYIDKHGEKHEGTVQSFLKSSSGKRWAPEFRDAEGRPLKAATPEFSAKWQEIARREPAEFKAAQHAYIDKDFYHVQAAHVAKTTGVDVEHRSRTMQNAVWSTAVQHGAGSDVVRDALRGEAARQHVKPPQLSDEDCLRAIYRERTRVFPVTQTRYAHEYVAAVGMLHAERMHAQAPPNVFEAGRREALGGLGQEIDDLRRRQNFDPRAGKIAVDVQGQERVAALIQDAREHGYLDLSTPRNGAVLYDPAVSKADRIGNQVRATQYCFENSHSRTPELTAGGSWLAYQDLSHNVLSGRRAEEVRQSLTEDFTRQASGEVRTFARTDAAEHGKWKAEEQAVRANPQVTGVEGYRWNQGQNVTNVEQLRGQDAGQRPPQQAAPPPEPPPPGNNPPKRAPYIDPPDPGKKDQFTAFLVSQGVDPHAYDHKLATRNLAAGRDPLAGQKRETPGYFTGPDAGRKAFEDYARRHDAAQYLERERQKEAEAKERPQKIDAEQKAFEQKMEAKWNQGLREAGIDPHAPGGGGGGGGPEGGGPNGGGPRGSGPDGDSKEKEAKSKAELGQREQEVREREKDLKETKQAAEKSEPPLEKQPREAKEADGKEGKLSQFEGQDKSAAAQQRDQEQPQIQQKAEQAKQEQDKQQQTKAEQQKQEQEKQQQVKAEQQKQEQEKQQQAKAEQQKQDQEKQQQAKAEQQKQEQEKQPQAKAEQQKQEQEKQPQAKAEQQKQEQEKQQQAKAEQQKQEQEKQQQAKAEQQKQEQEKQPQAKDEQQKEEQEKQQQAKAEQQKQEEKQQQAKAEQQKQEQEKQQQAKAEQQKQEQEKQQQAKAEQQKQEQEKQQQAKAEQQKEEQEKQPQAKAEQQKEEQEKQQQAKSEQQKQDQEKQQQAKAEQQKQEQEKQPQAKAEQQEQKQEQEKQQQEKQQQAKAEQQKQEQEKQQQAKAEQQKQEQEKQQQAKAEQQKQEQEKQEQEKQSQAKAEQQKQEQEKQPQAKAEQQKQEEKQQQAKAEQQKQEQEKQQQAKAEQQKQDQEKQQQTKSEQQKQEQEKLQQTKSEQQKEEQEKQPQAKAEQQKQEQEKQQQAKAEQQKQEQEKQQQAKAEQQKQEEAKQPQAKAEQQKQEQEKQQQTKAEQQKQEQEQEKQPQAKAEQQKEEQEKQQQAKAEQQKQEQEKQQQAKAEQQKQEQEKQQQAKAEQQKEEQEKQPQAKAEQHKEEQEKQQQAKAEQQKQEQEKQPQAKAEQQKADTEAAKSGQAQGQDKNAGDKDKSQDPNKADAQAAKSGPAQGQDKNAGDKDKSQDPNKGDAQATKSGQARGQDKNAGEKDKSQDPNKADAQAAKSGPAQGQDKNAGDKDKSQDPNKGDAQATKSGQARGQDKNAGEKDKSQDPNKGDAQTAKSGQAQGQDKNAGDKDKSQDPNKADAQAAKSGQAQGQDKNAGDKDKSQDPNKADAEAAKSGQAQGQDKNAGDKDKSQDPNKADAEAAKSGQAQGQDKNAGDKDKSQDPNKADAQAAKSGQAQGQDKNAGDKDKSQDPNKADAQATKSGQAQGQDKNAGDKDKSQDPNKADAQAAKSGQAQGQDKNAGDKDKSQDPKMSGDKQSKPGDPSARTEDTGAAAKESQSPSKEGSTPKGEGPRMRGFGAKDQEKQPTEAGAKESQAQPAPKEAAPSNGKTVRMRGFDRKPEDPPAQSAGRNAGEKAAPQTAQSPQQPAAQATANGPNAPQQAGATAPQQQTAQSPQQPGAQPTANGPNAPQQAGATAPQQQTAQSPQQPGVQPTVNGPNAPQQAGTTAPQQQTAQSPQQPGVQPTANVPNAPQQSGTTAPQQQTVQASQQPGVQPDANGTNQKTNAPASPSPGAERTAAPPERTGAAKGNDGGPPERTGASKTNDGGPPERTGASKTNDGGPPERTGASKANDGAPPERTGASKANDGAPPARSGAKEASDGGPPARSANPPGGATPPPQPSPPSAPSQSK